ncbi:uncharacterized protein LOC667063 [Mus musculus]|uniref:uncharacterized protein LOC667063 n=1 Tax=Mus musculus TaxID=10090 RepID=UPI00001E3684|nr:uncharacterized protein LOC667063 [Mus musculus]EDL30422.1 mCG1049242 [Mus musculus]|eukprot:NP_001095073.1 predicted gene 8439 [Mus musculus]
MLTPELLLRPLFSPPEVESVSWTKAIATQDGLSLTPRTQGERRVLTPRRWPLTTTTQIPVQRGCRCAQDHTAKLLVGWQAFKPFPQEPHQPLAPFL